jgi:hypothetical protein
VSNAVTARAAVLASEEQAISVRDGEGRYGDALPTFSPNSKRDVTTVLAVLEPHQRAPALGRSAVQGLSNRQRVRTRLPNWVAIVLSHAGKERLFDDNYIPGPIDVPVWVEPATGQVEGIDVDALTEQVAPMRELAERIWRDEDGFMRTPRQVMQAPRRAFHVAKSVKKGFGDVWGEIKGLKETGAPPAEPRPEHPPVEGVDYDTWIAVKAGLAVDDVHVSHIELYTTYRSVPSTRWPAVDAEWSRRAAADPLLQSWASFNLRRLGA